MNLLVDLIIGHRVKGEKLTRGPQRWPGYAATSSSTTTTSKRDRHAPASPAQPSEVDEARVNCPHEFTRNLLRPGPLYSQPAASRSFLPPPVATLQYTVCSFALVPFCRVRLPFLTPPPASWAARPSSPYRAGSREISTATAWWSVGNFSCPFPPATSSLTSWKRNKMKWDNMKRSWSSKENILKWDNKERSKCQPGKEISSR